MISGTFLAANIFAIIFLALVKCPFNLAQVAFAFSISDMWKSVIIIEDKFRTQLHRCLKIRFGDLIRSPDLEI